MRIASTIGATSLQHEGVDYEADESGMFDVPEPVGETLVRFPHFQREYEYLADREAEQAEKDVDPKLQASRIASIEQHLADAKRLQDEYDALKATHEATLAELEALKAEHAKILEAATAPEPSKAPAADKK